MEDQSLPDLSGAGPCDPDDTHDHARCRVSRRHGFLAGLVLGILGAGLIGFAIGATMPAAEAAFGPFGHRDHGCDHDREHGRDHEGPPTAAEARDHAEFFVAFALHRLAATPEQQDRVLKIVDSAVDQIFPVVEKHRANRQALRGILGGKTVDRDAIEKLRADEVALADNLSRVLSKSIADAAEVLTPDQRTQFLDHLDRFHHPS